MLNVRRESITQELGELKTAGLIRCQRGRITVIDRPNLEARACECYKGIKREFTRLMAPAVVPQVSSGLEQIWNARPTNSTPQPHFGVPTYSAPAASRTVRQEEELFARRYSRVLAVS